MYLLPEYAESLHTKLDWHWKPIELSEEDMAFIKMQQEIRYRVMQIFGLTSEELGVSYNRVKDKQ